MEESRVYPGPAVEELPAALDYVMPNGIVTPDDVSAAVRLGSSLGLASVSVPSGDADLAVRLLEGSQTAAASLVGWPFGLGSTAAKLYEARDLLRRGVKEIEFVVNLGKLAARQFQHVESELLQISKSCQENGALLKVVLETQHLAEDLKVIACKIVKRTEAAMVVTSAYPAEDGSEPANAALLKRVSKDVCAVSACAGGLEEALDRFGTGCTRLRTASPEALLAQLKAHVETLAQAPHPPSGAGPA